MNESHTRRGPDVGLFDAIDGFLGGISFVLFTPSVWGWAMVPAAMMLLLACGGTSLLSWGGYEALESAFGPDRGTGSSIGYWTLLVLSVAAALLIGVVLGLLLAQPLSGYALEKIAHAQERHLTGRSRPSPPFFTSIWLNIRAVAVPVLVGLPTLAFLVLIGLVFPPATVVTVPLKLLVCGWMLAWDFLDYPLGLRGLGVFARFHWVMGRPVAFTLFGLLWAGLCVVPGIVLLILPMGVAGATRMVIRDDPGAR